jgi:peptidoglycan/LPS O-acetylase OafA/YrhL
MIPLDWVRGIAAIAIVLYHFTTQYEVRLGHALVWPVSFPWGSLAVVIFFMLSGFLTVYQLNENTKPWNYCIKRLFRLYPAYWCCILITTVVTALFMPGFTKSLKTIFINATMLQSFLHVESVDGVYWTLAYELRFYAYIYLMLLLKQQKNIDKFLEGWLALTLSSQLVPDSGVFHYYRSGTELIFMSSRAAQFACGGCIALLVKNRNNVFAWIGTGLCVLLQLRVGGVGEIITLIIGIALISIGAMYSDCIKRSDKQWSSPVKCMHKLLVFVASISYPLYLLHQYVGWVVIRGLENIGMGSEVFIFIPIIVVMLLAFLVHQWVEKPVAIFSRRFLR